MDGCDVCIHLVQEITGLVYLFIRTLCAIFVFFYDDGVGVWKVVMFNLKFQKRRRVRVYYTPGREGRDVRMRPTPRIIYGDGRTWSGTSPSIIEGQFRPFTNNQGKIVRGLGPPRHPWTNHVIYSRWVSSLLLRVFFCN